MLADPAARLLALAAATDPAAVAPVVTAVIDPGALHAWGVKAIRHLTRVLPAIARKDPGLAVAVGTAPWQYEETRRTPTPMLGSAILELSGNLQQDVDGERYVVGTCFAELIKADPVAATTLLLAILQLPRMHQFPATDWRESPAVGQGVPLMFAGGHQVLTTMVDALARGMQDLAEAGSGQAGSVLDQIVGRLVGELHHGETWKRLLARAAAAPSAALARALLPALSTATLYAHHETWNEAAHAACRAVTLLTPEEFSQVQDAVRRIPDARTTPVTRPHAEALEQRADMILAALQQAAAGIGVSPKARSPESILPGGLPPLQDEPFMPFRGEWSREDTVPGSFDDLAHRIREQTQQEAHTPQGGDAAACRNLTALWDELDKLTAGGKGGQAEALDLAAEIAERMAACPDTAPDSPFGQRIILTFLAALPDPGSLQTSADSRNADQSSWASSLNPGWAVTATTRSAQALVRLYLDDSWRAARGSEIRAALTLLSDAPDPMYRLIACDVLPELVGEQDAQITELERRLSLEEDRHVATRLIYILARYVNQAPRRIDDVLNRLAAAPRWAVLSASPAGEQPIGPADQGSIGISIIAALGGVYGTPFAREVLDAWLMAPADHPQRATAALHSLSSLLNPADPAGWPAQERLLDVTGKGLAQVQAAFDDAAKAHGTPGQQQARASAAAKYADHLALLIYAESGAMDDKRQQPAQKQRGDLQRYALLAMPLLEGLSEIHVPSITHHVVQTADQIAPASPKKALLLAVKAVTGDEAYWREPAGAETVLGFIRRFAADHRAIFLGDREAVEAVRRLLESFIRLGWHQAIELAEELDELFN